MDDGVNNGGLKGGFVFAALAVFAARANSPLTYLRGSRRSPFTRFQLTSPTAALL